MDFFFLCVCGGGGGGNKVPRNSMELGSLEKIPCLTFYFPKNQHVFSVSVLICLQKSLYLRV